ncbi:MAG: hypothetical protein J3R72DRAFT_161752 [Linnemannia gamsii]|nr:MAG: hypothetical protein J3R72DRAFT_161752 [Linnemannia gamsii]
MSSSSPLSPPPSSASSLSSFTFPTSHTKAHLTLNSSIHINPFIIPPHSSLPSPLSPPLSISPPSSSFSLFNNHNHTMADTVVLSSTRLSDSLPPRHPSSPTASSTSSSHSNSNNTPSRTTALQRAATSAPALPFIQTSPEEWLAHAAQQRRHLSTGSFSSSTSSISSSTGRFTPDRNGLLQPQQLQQQRVQSPVQLAFGESEQVVSSDDERRQQLQQHQKYITSNHNNDKRIPDTTTTANGTDAGEKQEEEGEGEQEPLLNVNVRPSELRASLMARARRSSAKLQQQQRRSQSESMLLEKGSRLSGLSNQSFSSSSASAFDSRLSRSSTSSSISGWAPRARSSSVSSHGSNDSVNLDALIAGGSDINEECPLELEDGDDMTADWSKEDLLQQQQLLDDDDDDYEQLPVQGHRSRRSTGTSATSSMFHDDRQSDDYCDEPEVLFF